MEGHTVGNWVLEKELAWGGMSTVYLAHHKVLKTPAAVKLLPPALTSDKRLRDRFLLEAQSQAQLHHPHIAQVLDCLEQDGKWYLVVEYLENGSLADVIERAGGPVPIPQALQWITQALQALDVAHQHGVLHRDLKPANIMLDGSNNAKITDFGILETPHYLSPEQLVEPHQVDHRTDVYAIGIVLYQLLTGKVPFDSDTDFSAREAQVNPPPPGLCELNPEVPQGLAEVLKRALAKDRDHRYAGCGEFARAIQRFLGGAGATDVRPPPAPDKVDVVSSGVSTEPASSPADLDEGAAVEERNARIDALYAEVRKLMARGEREPAVQAAIQDRLNELRMLQKVEADAMRRRFEARLFLPPGAGLEALRNARRLLADDANLASAHDSASRTD